MINDWTTLLHKRRQYDGWDLEKECPTDVVLEILEEQNTFASKKNNQPNFEIILVSGFNNDNIELRELIYEWTIVDEPGVPYGINPQTLAHHILLFKLKDNQDSEDDAVGLIQIGIASSYIALGATARGLQTGYCRCFNSDDSTLDDAVNQKLGIFDKKPIELLLGIGYENNHNMMINPTSNKPVFTHARTYPETTRNPLPKLNSYLTIHGK